MGTTTRAYWPGDPDAIPMAVARIVPGKHPYPGVDPPLGTWRSVGSSREIYRARYSSRRPSRIRPLPAGGHGIQGPAIRLDEGAPSLAWMDRYVRNGGQNLKVYRVGDRYRTGTAVAWSLRCQRRYHALHRPAGSQGKDGPTSTRAAGNRLHHKQSGPGPVAPEPYQPGGFRYTFGG